LRGTPACTFPPPIQDILCAVSICHGHVVIAFGGVYEAADVAVTRIAFWNSCTSAQAKFARKKKA